MPDRIVNQACAVVDQIDGLTTSVHALLAVEALIEPSHPAPAHEELLKVNKEHFYALISLINTRLVLDLREARVQAQAVAERVRS